MPSSRKEQIRALLKGIETGDPQAVAVVNEGKYIQHNPLTREGNVGLAELFKRLAQTSPQVEVVRVFEDGDFVFAHTDYDFNEVEIGFEVFRFEDGFAVEHWDNLQSRADSPFHSARSTSTVVPTGFVQRPSALIVRPLETATGGKRGNRSASALLRPNSGPRMRRVVDLFHTLHADVRVDLCC
jgi:predicted SnoaL-like aldol condensation-catalyzing enzyme